MATLDTIQVYATEDYSSQPVFLRVSQIKADIRRAAYHFWLSERRMPAAVVMSNQLAQALLGSPTLNIQTVQIYPNVELDDVTEVPVIGRDAGLDPLWILI